MEEHRSCAKMQCLGLTLRIVEYNSKLRTPNSYFILNNCGRPSGFGIEPINDFIYCLQNDLPFIADGNDGLQAELIAEAVHESLEKGVAVKLKRD